MSIEEAEYARELYEEWFRLYPNQKNPTDMNTQEKWDAKPTVKMLRYY